MLFIGIDVQSLRDCPYAVMDANGHVRENGWLPTGDLFRVRENGHLEIVDRIKDIYKNSKGQTVAPGAIEQKLAHVPGIARQAPSAQRLMSLIMSCSCMMLDSVVGQSMQGSVTDIPYSRSAGSAGIS